MVSAHQIPFILKKVFSAVHQTVIKIVRLVTLTNIYFVTNPIGINTLKGITAVEGTKSAAIFLSCVSVSW